MNPRPPTATPHTPPDAPAEPPQAQGWGRRAGGAGVGQGLRLPRPRLPPKRFRPALLAARHQTRSPQDGRFRFNHFATLLLPPRWAHLLSIDLGDGAGDLLMGLGGEKEEGTRRRGRDGRHDGGGKSGEHVAGGGGGRCGLGTRCRRGGWGRREGGGRKACQELRTRCGGPQVLCLQPQSQCRVSLGSRVVVLREGGWANLAAPRPDLPHTPTSTPPPCPEPGALSSLEAQPHTADVQANCVYQCVVEAAESCGPRGAPSAAGCGWLTR